jgi:hypothetical protein
VIVENIESVPLPPAAGTIGYDCVEPAPPAPTVIGKDVAPLNEIFVPPGNEVLNPPAPPPPPVLSPPPPPPATTK